MYTTGTDRNGSNRRAYGVRNQDDSQRIRRGIKRNRRYESNQGNGGDVANRDELEESGNNSNFMVSS